MGGGPHGCGRWSTPGLKVESSFISGCQAQEFPGLTAGGYQSFSGAGLLLGQVPHWAPRANYMAARTDDSQSSSGHLSMMAEETVGTAQGAKVSLRRDLPCGWRALERRQELLPGGDWHVAGAGSHVLTHPLPHPSLGPGSPSSTFLPLAWLLALSGASSEAVGGRSGSK